MINKDTRLYGSFSIKSGNNGCTFFNTAFAKFKIDALYRSYSVTSIKDAVFSAKVLGFSGFAVSMPFKVDVLKYVDELSEEVHSVGSANTVVVCDKKLKAYNTDYYASLTLMKELKNEVYILGNGGLSKSVQASAKVKNIKHFLITRKNWSDMSFLRNKTVINCTPIKNIQIDISNKFIDLNTDTLEGKKFSIEQAKQQFFLYTGKKYE
jgi:shikimate dehydrogenase